MFSRSDFESRGKGPSPKILPAGRPRPLSTSKGAIGPQTTIRPVIGPDLRAHHHPRSKISPAPRSKSPLPRLAKVFKQPALPGWPFFPKARNPLFPSAAQRQANPLGERNFKARALSIQSLDHLWVGLPWEPFTAPRPSGKLPPSPRAQSQPSGKPLGLNAQSRGKLGPQKKKRSPHYFFPPPCKGKAIEFFPAPTKAPPARRLPIHGTNRRLGKNGPSPLPRPKTKTYGPLS